MAASTINDKGKIGWYRTCWTVNGAAWRSDGRSSAGWTISSNSASLTGSENTRRGVLREDHKSAWHFCAGQGVVRFSIVSPIPKAICGYAAAHFTSPRDWSSEPDPAKLIGPVCARCRRLTGR